MFLFIYFFLFFLTFIFSLIFAFIFSYLLCRRVVILNMLLRNCWAFRTLLWVFLFYLVLLIFHPFFLLSSLTPPFFILPFFFLSSTFYNFPPSFLLISSFFLPSFSFLSPFFLLSFFLFIFVLFFEKEGITYCDEQRIRKYLLEFHKVFHPALPYEISEIERNIGFALPPPLKTVS